MPTRLALVVAAAVGRAARAGLGRAGRPRRPPAPPAPPPRRPGDGDGEAARAVRAAGLRPVGYAASPLAVLPLFPARCRPSTIDPPPHFITAGGWRPYVPAGRTLVPVPIPSNVHGLPTLRWSALTGHEFPVPGGYFIGPNAQGEGVFGAPNRAHQHADLPTMDAGALPAIDRRATAGRPSRTCGSGRRRWWCSARIRREAVLRELMTGLLGPAAAGRRRLALGRPRSWSADRRRSAGQLADVPDPRAARPGGRGRAARPRSARTGVAVARVRPCTTTAARQCRRSVDGLRGGRRRSTTGTCPVSGGPPQQHGGRAGPARPSGPAGRRGRAGR